MAETIQRTLLNALREEKAGHVKGGIYHKVQVELTYNSNHIEGSRLTHDQTRYIYETNTIGMENGVLNVDDIVPFIIDEELKLFYYRGLHEWKTEPGYRMDTCLAAQDKFKAYLDYFRISYQD